MNSRANPRLLNVPNTLCVIRLIGSPILVVLAAVDLPLACMVLFIFLSLTDWFDGKLAKLLKQETEFGARLDTVADVTFYACSLLALFVLRGELFLREWVFVSLAVGSYLVSVIAALIKYRRMPSYHTRLAKTSWFLAFIAIVSTFANGSIWIARFALLGVVITNVEAILITLLLPKWRANVPSVFHIRWIRDEPPA